MTIEIIKLLRCSECGHAWLPDFEPKPGIPIVHVCEEKVEKMRDDNGND